MKNALAITGYGLMSAVGSTHDAHRHSLQTSRCHLHCFDDPCLPLAQQLPVGRVTSPLETAPTRSTALGLAAVQQALKHADIHDPQALGLIVGSCTGGMSESESVFLEYGPDALSSHYRWQPAQCGTVFIAERCGLQGPINTHSVACASAACALIEAMEWLRQGLIPAVCVLGCDALCRITMAGFSSLKVVDPAGCRPLSQERAGMNLGEAGAALIIETAAHATARGATIRANVLGWGLRADAHHAAAPEPKGEQLERAIRDALNNAKLSPRAINYISAHGTGTLDNDACESAVIARIFDEVPTASCKRIFGHTMGASAAVEAVVSCLALEHGEWYPNAGGANATPIDDITVADHVGSLNSDAYILSTTLAFGGTNAALIFGRANVCN